MSDIREVSICNRVPDVDTNHSSSRLSHDIKRFS